MLVLLVLRAGRRRGEKRTPLECQMKVVELREKEFAVAVVLGACVRLRGGTAFFNKGP